MTGTDIIVVVVVFAILIAVLVFDWWVRRKAE